MFSILSPNMLKTYSLCPKKFYLKYIKGISMPVNNDIFEFGKNIHALASYYLKKENIDKMEASLNEREAIVWKYLKNIEYFSYEVVNTEYNLAVKVDTTFFGGRIDAIVKKDNEYFILDYKTGSIPQNAKFDYQTMIYILAVREFFKTDKVSFVYIDLKNKDELKIALTSELEEEYKTRLSSIASKILSDEIPNKKSDCNCEYSCICY